MASDIPRASYDVEGGLMDNPITFIIIMVAWYGAAVFLILKQGRK
jgi:hypothetical protein